MDIRLNNADIYDVKVKEIIRVLSAMEFTTDLEMLFLQKKRIHKVVDDIYRLKKEMLSGADEEADNGK